MSSIQAISNVAFMGLGTMGMLMAGRLLDSGIAVNGYDVDPAATATLEDAGGTASASPAQAAADASIVLLMVTTAEEVMSVLFAPRTGAVHGLRENATIIVILNSTVQPTVPQDVRHRLDSEFRRSDVVVLDAPVTGGMKDAQDGMLSIMVSAARADHLERSDVKDVLARITQKVYHISGPLGSALKVKVLNQVLCGIHIVAAAEIMGLAAVMGMDTRRFYESVASPGVELGRKKNCWSWMFEDRVPRMLDYKLPMESAMSNILRDVGAVNKEAERAGVRLSLYKASQVVYERAVKLGLQEADDSAVFQVCFRYDTDQGSERTKTLQMVSEMGGLYPEDEAGRLAGLLGDALAAVHTMAAYEALVLAEGMHMCRTLKQCKQWIEILGSAAAGSMVFIKGMPRIFESETHGTGSLELLVPRREGLLESLREVIELARNENQHLALLFAAENFFQQASVEWREPAIQGYTESVKCQDRLDARTTVPSIKRGPRDLFDTPSDSSSLLDWIHDWPDMDEATLLSEYRAGNCSYSEYNDALQSRRCKILRLVIAWKGSEAIPRFRGWQGESTEEFFRVKEKEILSWNPPFLQEYLAGERNGEVYLGSIKRWRDGMENANAAPVHGSSRPSTISTNTSNATRPRRAFSERQLLSKRKREDDENWLLTYTGKLSIRERKARKELLEKRERSAKARLNPIVVDGKDDSLGASQVQMLPTPPASSPPVSQAQLVIIDLESDDEEGIGASTLPSSSSSNLNIRLEPDLTKTDPEHVPPQTDSPGSHDESHWKAKPEFSPTLRNAFNTEPWACTIASISLFSASPTLLQDPLTSAWTLEVTELSRCSGDPHDHVEHHGHRMRANVASAMDDTLPSDDQCLNITPLPCLPELNMSVSASHHANQSFAQVLSTQNILANASVDLPATVPSQAVRSDPFLYQQCSSAQHARTDHQPRLAALECGHAALKQDPHHFCSTAHWTQQDSRTDLISVQGGEVDARECSEEDEECEDEDWASEDESDDSEDEDALSEDEEDDSNGSQTSETGHEWLTVESNSGKDAVQDLVVSDCEICLTSEEKDVLREALADGGDADAVQIVETLAAKPEDDKEDEGRHGEGERESLMGQYYAGKVNIEDFIGREDLNSEEQDVLQEAACAGDADAICIVKYREEEELQRWREEACDSEEEEDL